ncbi:MAG: trypsin-like peptidase domain-containing protein [Actinomycetota bacterium]|nr:trypsin-like peptidase domain-containing protein [Actinomycetota bacterium]
MRWGSRASSVLLFAVLAAVLAVGCSEERPGSKRGNAVAAQTTREAPAPSRIPEDEPVARVAARVGPSVVQVNIEVAQQTPLGTQRGEGVGSGVIYRPEGYVITNSHVVDGASEVDVSFADGTTEPAEIVGTDPFSEIAVLRVDRSDLPAADFNAEDLLVGQLAVAIGSPSGFESTVTSGIVSAVGREFPPELTGGDEEASRSLVDLVQTDAAISPGYSGGALANRDGEIIGINVAYLPPSETGAVNLGFAIPSDTATSIADQLIETGEVSTPYLGVVTTDLNPEDAERFGLPLDSGVLVERVERGSGAAEAGVRRGDVITVLGGSEIADYGDLLGALRDYRPGDTARLTVIRSGDERTLSVTLGERTE